MASKEQQSSPLEETSIAPLPSPRIVTSITTDIPARSESPSPSVTPSLALDAIPVLDRSVSTPSSSAASTLSSQSRQSRLSDGGSTVIKRRGYMRPQGTAFADSARNRDSVMSLGSIAHMQYYFARTGLLDGKGAQLARGTRKKSSSAQLNSDKENVEPSLTPSTTGTITPTSMRSMSHSTVSRDDFSLGFGSMSINDGNSSAYAVSDPGQDASLVESPTELYAANPELWGEPGEAMMLPPTVSTYKLKPEYTEPVPDLPVLRRELKEALQDACKVLEESQKEESTDTAQAGRGGNNSAGFYEVQGLHMLDITTLAIRAAKNYYTAHPLPQRLYAIKAEKHIRAELYQVLDILKRMASRNFRGGIRLGELTEIITWIESIDQMLKKEEAAEQAEAAEREAWAWREGSWQGREREREWLFLKSFDDPNSNVKYSKHKEGGNGHVNTNAPPAAAPAAATLSPLPQWHDAGPSAAAPNDFLRALQDGTRLVRLHNALVTRSQRRFATIASWHIDVAKPYRVAENLRFWAKAAELRWDLHLDVPALDIAQAPPHEPCAAWDKFDAAVLRWCQAVRTELTAEWEAEALSAERKRPPELKVELSDGSGEPAAA